MSASSFLTDLSLIVAAAAAGQELAAFRTGLIAAGEAGVTRRVPAPENSTVYVSEVASTPGYDLAALVLHGRKRDLYLLQPHEQRLVLPNGLSVEVRHRSNPRSGLLGWNKTQGGETRGYFLRTPAPGFDPWYSIRKHSIGYGGSYFSVEREPSGSRSGEYVGQAGTLGLAKDKAEEDAQDMLQWVSAGMPTPRANSGMAPFGGDMGFGRNPSNFYPGSAAIWEQTDPETATYRERRVTIIKELEPYGGERRFRVRYGKNHGVVAEVLESELTEVGAARANPGGFEEELRSRLSPAAQGRTLRVRSSGGSGTLYINFYNLPEEVTARREGGGAEAENNRAMYVVEPLGDGRFKVSTSVSVFPRDYSVRTKTAAVDKAAQHLAAGINRIAEEIPPNYTHTRANSGMAPFGGPGAPAMFNNMSAVLEGEGPRRNSGGRLAVNERVTMRTGHHTGIGSSNGIVVQPGPWRTLVQFDDGALVDVDNQALTPLRRNLGDGPPPPPPIGNPTRRNHHLSPGDQVSMGDFVGTVVQSVPGKYDDYTVRWETGKTEKVAGHKLRLLRANPALRDYFGAGRQTAREIGGALAQAPGELMGEVHKGVGKLHSGLKAMGARARAAAERVEAGRKCEPTPEEAIRALAQAHRVKLNPAKKAYPTPLSSKDLAHLNYSGQLARERGTGDEWKDLQLILAMEGAQRGLATMRQEHTAEAHIAQIDQADRDLQRALTQLRRTAVRTHLNPAVGGYRLNLGDGPPPPPPLALRANLGDGPPPPPPFALRNPASDGETGKLIHQVDVPGKGQVRVFDPRPKNLWYNLYITLNNGAEARYALHSGGFTGRPYWGTNGRAPAWALSALMAEGFDWQVV